jgi:hypothetical protein
MLRTPDGQRHKQKVRLSAMTETKFNTWDEAVKALRDMKSRHTLGTLEQWAIDYAVRCVQRDKKVRNGLTRTEQVIRETEAALTQEFEAFEEPTDAEKRYRDIESRR